MGMIRQAGGEAAMASAKTCLVCGADFLPDPANVARQITCGAACRAARDRAEKRGRYANPIPMDGDMVLCRCGEAFPREYDRLGRPSNRRLCPECRATPDRLRDAAYLAAIPEGAARCSACGCLLAPCPHGARPAGDGRCEHCSAWESRMAAKAARMPSAGGLSAILDHHGVLWREVIGRRGNADIVAARIEAAAYHRAKGWSLEQIGRLLHRNYTTVSYMLDTWDIAHGGPASHHTGRPDRAIGALRALVDQLPAGAMTPREGAGEGGG